MVLKEHLRHLVQYFLHYGAISEPELTELIDALRDRYDLKIKPKDEIKVFQQSYLAEINRQIRNYGFNIKECTSEEFEQEKYYCCTQNLKPDFVKIDVSYSERDAAIFEKMLETIITSDEKCVNAYDTIFLSVLANGLKITKAEFTDVMTRFRKEKWIESPRESSQTDNTIILHIRTLTEMNAYLMDNYKDFISTCKICNRLMLRGLICDSCDCHLHRSCGLNYFRSLAKTKKIIFTMSSL